MHSGRGLFRMQGIDPCRRGGETTEGEMIFDSGLIAALGVKCADLMLEFLETALDFPSGGIILDHFLRRKREIGGDQWKHIRVSAIDEEYETTSVDHVVKQRFGPKPAVANNQRLALKQVDQPGDQLSADPGFRLQPLLMRPGPFSVTSLMTNLLKIARR